jgi:hypothetical protein
MVRESVLRAVCRELFSPLQQPIIWALPQQAPSTMLDAAELAGGLCA